MNNDSFNPNEYGNQSQQTGSNGNPQGGSQSAPQGQPTQGAYSGQPYGNTGYQNPQQSYNGQPYTPYQPPVQPAHGLGVASLVCAIVGILCCGLLTSIPAIICAAMARKQGNTETITTVGLILGIIGTVLNAIATVAMLAMLPVYMEMMEEIFKQSLEGAMFLLMK